MADRPAVSVVVPFLGEEGAARSLLGRLARLRLRPGDEIIVADNCRQPTVRDDLEPPARRVRAARWQSSYHARNVGAEAAGNDWLLFLDADTAPPADLIDAFFGGSPPEPSVGIVAGEVEGAPDQTALAARRLRTWEHLRAARMLERGPFRSAGTANLLVRRLTWEQLGGFLEVRSGADLEFCWRAQAAGWTLDYRPEARVEHLHVDTIAATLRKARFYAPGQAWLNRRFPGGAPQPSLLRELARAIAGSLVWTLRLHFDRAAFKAIDGLWAVNYAAAYLAGSNRPEAIAESASAGDGDPQSLDVVVSRTCGDSDGAALAQANSIAAGDRAVRLIAAARSRVVDRSAVDAHPTTCLEDDSPTAAAAALTWYAAHHPVRLLRAARAWRSGARTKEGSAWQPGIGRIACAARSLPPGGIRVHSPDWPAGGAALSALVG